MEQVIILGTGGNCVDILDTLCDINDRHGKTIYECVGFLDDAPGVAGRSVCGVPVLGPLAAAAQYPEARFINGIGSPANFWRKAEIIATTGLGPERFLSVIHPSATVSRTARIGRGVVIFAHVVIATNVVVGDHVIILPGSVLSHDDFVGDYTTLAGRVCVSGQVTIGDSSYLGAGALVRQGLHIGRQSLLGMGAVVVRDVPDGMVVAGNPAKVLRQTR